MNNKLMWAEALMAEGGLLPADVALSLIGEGYDITAIQDRIDGFSITDELLETLTEYELY